MIRKKLISPKEVVTAYNRIKDFVKDTPILSSNTLNSYLGHNIYFKTECLQTTGSFKLRGCFNALLQYQEEHHSLPERVVAFSTGNHGQGLAFACNKLGIRDLTIYMTVNASTIKKQAIESYGGKVISCKTRAEIYERIEKDIKEGAYNISTSANDMVIAGQGTASYEALTKLKKQKVKIDAIFCPAGSGGLTSGTYLTSQLKVNGKPKVYAVEPELANDIKRSLENKKIFKFEKEILQTIADGARTPSIHEKIFEYLKKVDGVFEVSEKEIIYWTQWISHLLELKIEPTAALSMAGCFQWLKTQQKQRNVLVILSGGNYSETTYKQIWKTDYLSEAPKL